MNVGGDQSAAQSFFVGKGSHSDQNTYTLTASQSPRQSAERPSISTSTHWTTSRWRLAVPI